jgi:hypothetical protein
MKDVYITYTALAERWEVAVRDQSVMIDPQPVTDRLWIGRNSSGEISEILLDAVEWQHGELEIVEQAFDVTVRSALEHLVPESDLELFVQVASRSEIDHFGQQLPDIPGEPGIPAPVETTAHLTEPNTAVYEVPDVFDPAVARAVDNPSAEVHLRYGHLRVLLPSGTAARNLWVRISAASSGTLLHIAPVLTPAGSDPAGSDPAGSDPTGSDPTGSDPTGSDPAGTSASVTWGLGEDLRRIHLRVTDNPTIPVGNQSERRVAWVERLLTDAGERERRPGMRIHERRRSAQEAQRVAEIAGDEALIARARAQQLRLRWWRIARFGLFAGLVILAGALLAAVLTGADPSDAGPSPTGPELSLEDDDPEALAGGQVGPAVFIFADRAEVHATIIGGLPVYRPGDSLELRTSVSIVIDMGYGPGPADEETSEDIALEVARENCLSAQNVPADQLSFQNPDRNLIVRLSRRGSDAAGTEPTESTSVIAEVLNLQSRWSTFSSITERCLAPEFGRANRYIGQAIMTAVAERHKITLPVGLPPGLWDVQLLLEAQPIEVDGELRIRIIR